MYTFIVHNILAFSSFHFVVYHFVNICELTGSHLYASKQYVLNLEGLVEFNVVISGIDYCLLMIPYSSVSSDSRYRYIKLCAMYPACQSDRLFLPE